MIYVYNPDKYGGVKDVTLNLCIGFVENGFQSVIVSSFYKLIFLSLMKRDDYFILSLNGGLVAPFVRNRAVYIVHGFPVRSMYGRLRYLMINCVPKLCNIFGIKTVAVSNLTKTINLYINNIKIDRVILNGVSNKFLSVINKSKKKKQILYLGRLVASKKISESIDSFLKSSLKNALGYKFIVAGTGPDYIKLKSQYYDYRDTVIFLGYITDEDKYNLLVDSEIFISLHNLEPMGVVYLEALSTGCKIIAPQFAGCREFIPRDYPAIFCDPDDMQTIVMAMESIANTEKVNYYDSSAHSYTRVARAYLDVLMLNKPV